jgi:hypothetical protein
MLSCKDGPVTIKNPLTWLSHCEETVPPILRHHLTLCTTLVALMDCEAVPLALCAAKEASAAVLAYRSCCRFDVIVRIRNSFEAGATAWVNQPAEIFLLRAPLPNSNDEFVMGAAPEDAPVISYLVIIRSIALFPFHVGPYGSHLARLEAHEFCLAGQ